MATRPPYSPFLINPYPLTNSCQGQPNHTKWRNLLGVGNKLASKMMATIEKDLRDCKILR